MKPLLFVLIILILSSCEYRKVKYSGLNDLVVGVHQIVLYENGEFYLELGVGGAEGKYQISNDTIRLEYYGKNVNWPNKIVMRREYFETINNLSYQRTIKIKRYNAK